MMNILISTYNGERFIEQQLDSILKQRDVQFKIYIRDDGSTDHTVEVIKQYQKQHSLETQLELYEGENIGFCPSFFALLHKASDGDYWAFCDQDDVWYPDKLVKAKRWLDAHDEKIPLLYHSGVVFGDSTLQLMSNYENPCPDFNFQKSITSNIFYGFASVVNRAMYEKLLCADPQHIKYHDWFMAMIVTAFGRYHFSNDVQAVHRLHESNTSPTHFFQKIPQGLKLLKGDDFYNENAREFLRLYGTELTEEDRKVLELFTNKRYHLKNALKKMCYPKRWNYRFSTELIFRMLMLLGRM